MITLKFEAYEYELGVNDFMKQADLIAESSFIGESVTISIKVDKKEVTEEYINSLIKKIEEMDVSKKRYTNVKYLGEFYVMKPPWEEN